MADQSDVEAALASLVANALYPAGTAVPSPTGYVCRVYRGYPAAPVLDGDLAEGVVHVSVAGVGAVKNMTRYPRIWQEVTPVPATLIVNVTAYTAVFSGRCAVGQLAGVAVNGAIFAYAVQVSDTPSTVASNLAALLRQAGWLVNYEGSAVTVPAADMFTARVVNGAGALQEIKRQQQDFKIMLWCPDPASRDVIGSMLDISLAAPRFLALADGSFARMRYAGGETIDSNEDAALYRRELIYSAEYPTTLQQITPAMLFGTTSLRADAAFVENLQG
jgi:hypothetical protein